MPTMHDSAYVVARINDLRERHQEELIARTRIKNIMSGGPEAIREILGTKALQQYTAGHPIPLPPTLIKGLDRLSQKIAEAPSVRVRPHSDRESAKKFAFEREQVVKGFDLLSKMKRQYHYVSRWTPGYGFGVWILKHGEHQGVSYPHAQLRNPYNCFPSEMNADLEPDELAVLRNVSATKLRSTFDKSAPYITGTGGISPYGWGSDTPYPYMGGIPSEWDGPTGADSTRVAEFYDITGTYLVHIDSESILSYIPNPITRPPFVIERRPSFDSVTGAYDHLIGLLSVMARINILSLMAMQDAIMRETNIIGADGMSKAYQRGRGKLNYLPPGTRVEQPQTNLPYQYFQLKNEVEQQIRQGASYPVTDDGASSISFVTGEGLRELGASVAQEIGELQTVRQFALEELDSRRLEWDQKAYGGSKKKLNLNELSLDYDPAKLIKGNWTTSRKFGILSGYDKPQQVVVALQLLQAGIVDIETVQENMEGMSNIPQINKRKLQDQMESTLMATLAGMVEQGDPRAMQAIVEIYSAPQNIEQILKKFFTPEQPELSPEEQAFLQQQQAGGFGGPGGGQEDITTLLSKLTSGGEEGTASIGSQTVGRL